ncbi:hypothetical protein M426DRAFT_16521 [Hypoxylon sp. CI-4A]|nr:hypothetical protein M426DRAFT_16521 [Hypoxylon sp. CI-4A]
MSSQPKITSKNLAYSSDLPPFLAKLRGQHQQERDSDAPDPILAARRRAARPRSASEEAEDAPLVVDEEGNTVDFSPDADADADTKHDDDDNDKSSGDDATGKEKEKEKEKVAGIGAGKKRKVGRVVGAGEDETETEIPYTSKSTKPTERDGPTITATKKDDKRGADAKSTTSTPKQGKKKAKKIKLSFGDDD